MRVIQLWQIHNAEQLILDDMEANPDKYKGKKLSELTDDEEFDDENSVEYTKVNYKKALLPKIILVSTFVLYFIILFSFAFGWYLLYIFGRKLVLKNLTWKLPWLSVRWTIPLTFCSSCSDYLKAFLEPYWIYFSF